MSFLEEIPDQDNEHTSLPKDSEKENPDTGSAGVASADDLDSSSDDKSTNEEFEEEQSSGDSSYRSDRQTENYADSDNADLENETDRSIQPSPPRTRSTSKRGT